MNDKIWAPRSIGTPMTLKSDKCPILKMVRWIGKVSLLLKRLKDSCMDMLPMSALSEEQ